MNKGMIQRLLPHLIAVIIFLIVSVIYCRPALEGKVVNQNDITHWKGSIHQSEVYKEAHGHYPLWTNGLFGGMPTFQIGGVGENYVGGIWHTILTLGLPKPISFFFLACICFYFLCVVLRSNPWVGIMGALAFAYATYNPIIISVGHETKMFTMAYMPAVLASVLLIYERRYWLGAALTALFASTLIAMNHLQIAYYLFLTLGIMTIFYAVRWIKNKEWKHMGFALSSLIVAAIVGVLTNAVILFSTYEYQKYTIRGGGSELTDTTQTVKSKTGLDKGYAFNYSMKISEPLVMMVPRMYGGSSDKEEVSQDESKAIEALRTLPQELQNQLPMAYYWGGIGNNNSFGTSGPPYVGALICFLAILSLFLSDSKHRWWAWAAIIITIMMSWGSYFDAFNSVLYNLLPFYNKFRAPSMILVIPQLLLPMLAVIGVNSVTNTADRKSLLPQFKKGLITTGAVFVLLFVLYISFDFMGPGDKNILNQVRGMNQPQLYEYIRVFFEGLKDDRKSLMIGDIFRSLGFVAVGVVVMYLLLKNLAKPVVAALILAAFTFIDLVTVDLKYLNSDNYSEQTENEASFVKTAFDEQLQADKSFYRVYNVAPDRFQENITSYYYNSVGGYHPAKLLIYQDLIERQLSNGNEKVLDMLNTKYLLQKDRNGQTQAFQQRPTALGAAWFVNHVQFVKNPDEEMAALNNFNPRDTAFVQEKFRASVQPLAATDSTASIQLVKNDNDVVSYTSQSSANGFAVFSEIYYPAGWKAFIDGKETPVVKTDYVLRGLSVPAGTHKIEFRFEPSGYHTGKTVATISLIILFLLFAVAIFMEWRNRRTVQDNKQA